MSFLLSCSQTRTQRTHCTNGGRWLGSKGKKIRRGRKKKKKMGDTLGSSCQFGVAKFNLKEGRDVFFPFEKASKLVKSDV